MNFRLKSILLLIILLAGGSTLIADSVKIKKTGTVYPNVKTSTEKGVVTVDFEDGSQKRFRTKDVAVTPSEVVWLVEEKEEPNFIQKLFSFGDSSESDEEVEKQEETATTTASAEEEEESSIPYLGEGIFGGVALLFLILP